MKLVPLKTGRTCQPVDSFVHHRIRRIPLPGERKLYNYPVNYHDPVHRSRHASNVSLTKDPIFNCDRFSIRIIYLPPLLFYWEFTPICAMLTSFFFFSLSPRYVYKEEKSIESNTSWFHTSLYLYLRERNQLLRKFVIPLVSIYEKH